jgi:hypothetical protein
MRRGEGGVRYLIRASRVGTATEKKSTRARPAAAGGNVEWGARTGPNAIERLRQRLHEGGCIIAKPRTR